MTCKEWIGMRPHRVSGFSLIEIMVVVAVVGILASIALPSYLEHQRKTRRAAGTACLSAMAQAMERHYTTQLAYDTNAPTVAALVARCEPEVRTFYNFARPVLGARTYRITATPTGRQTGDTCNVLSLDQAGAKLPTTAGCW